MRVSGLPIKNAGEVSKHESIDCHGQKHYHVGTLSYTKRGLIVLFAWMLWGDFCFQLMEMVVPIILPVKLKALGSSNIVIALIMSTLPGILNTTICPWVSFRSDRYRSKWGRRIPFIIFTLPFLTMFLILLGFSEQIGTWVHTIAFAHNGMFSATTVAIVFIGVFMVGFQFFNMFVGSVFWYFFNDVVPERFMGQFLGLFRVVASLAGILFNQFVMKYVETHMTEIFVGAAVLYFVGFGLMCLRVKEGEYPPPPEYVGGKQGFMAGLKTFFVECFSLRFYWYMFGMTTCLAVAGSAGIFNLFFIKDIGLTLQQYGHIAACAGFISMLLTYPAGLIADKFHPLRVELTVLTVTVLTMPLNLAYLVFNISPEMAYTYYFAVTLITLPASTLFGASQLPTEMRIFPRERFGQFCSAQAMIRSFGTIAGGLIAGGVFDLLKWHYNGSDFAYRWLPAWSWLFYTLGLCCLVQVYRSWKRYGGLENYVPPLPAGSEVGGDVETTPVSGFTKEPETGQETAPQSI
jgi:MFS family permease